MTEQTRNYVHRMYEDASRFHQAKRLREDEKRALIAADNWDAVDAWNEREKLFPDPFTSGQYKAYWAFDRSSEIETGDLEMNDFLWEYEVKDFTETLRAAGLTTFVMTNQSTGLMRNIHELEAEGWRLVGACKLAVKENRYGCERIEERLGLRFEIEKEG